MVVRVPQLMERQMRVRSECVSVGMRTKGISLAPAY